MGAFLAGSFVLLLRCFFSWWFVLLGFAFLFVCLGCLGSFDKSQVRGSCESIFEFGGTIDRKTIERVRHKTKNTRQPLELENRGTALETHSRTPKQSTRTLGNH